MSRPVVLSFMVGVASLPMLGLANAHAAEDQLTLLQAATHTLDKRSRLASDDGQQLAIARALHIPAASSELWPFSLLHKPFATVEAGSSIFRPSPTRLRSILMGPSGVVLLFLVVALAGAKILFLGSDAIKAVSLGALYICTSALMIETNKWLMSPGHFPYPLALTTNHMLMSLVLANCLRWCCPSAFPSLEKLCVTPWFCLKFLPIGAAFALSVVCGNGAYTYLSVSFLQVMKQGNVVIIYTMSVLCGLEALRRCSIVLLAGTLCGTLLAIHGEMHFQAIGFLLQLASSLSEAAKVIVQGILMSGTYKLDPLTMVLFMAPACLLANLMPLAISDGPRLHEIFVQMQLHFPLIIANATLAFGLNVIVAQCIKQLSPVGYLLCGIVKDVCIIVTSSFFLGESLAPQQIVGFTLALSGVASYSLYKQHQDCFHDDALVPGFVRVAQSLFMKAPLKATTHDLLKPEPPVKEEQAQSENS